jgi:hypothetical protein
MNDPLESRLQRHRVRPAPEALTESLVAVLQREALRHESQPNAATPVPAWAMAWKAWGSVGSLWACGLALLLVARLSEIPVSGAPAPGRLNPEQAAQTWAEIGNLRRLAGLDPAAVDPDPVLSGRSSNLGTSSGQVGPQSRSLPAACPARA